jgi:hypothetical protein
LRRCIKEADSDGRESSGGGGSSSGGTSGATETATGGGGGKTRARASDADSVGGTIDVEVVEIDPELTAFDRRLYGDASNWAPQDVRRWLDTEGLSEWGEVGPARYWEKHVIRCHLTQETRVWSVLDDVASNIWVALGRGVREAGGGRRHAAVAQRAGPGRAVQVDP